MKLIPMKKAYAGTAVLSYWKIQGLIRVRNVKRRELFSTWLCEESVNNRR